MEKLKYKMLEVRQSKTKNISPHEVLELRLINTVYHLLVKNNKKKGRRGGRDFKERGLIYFFLLKRGAYLGEGAKQRIYGNF